MIKLRVGKDKDGAASRSQGSGGNNVEAPVEDDGHESSDQERAVGGSGVAGNPRGRGPKKDKGPLKRDDKDSHRGVSLDEEARERQTSEGGPANSGARHGGEHGHDRR